MASHTLLSPFTAVSSCVSPPPVTIFIMHFGSNMWQRYQWQVPVTAVPVTAVPVCSCTSTAWVIVYHITSFSLQDPSCSGAGGCRAATRALLCKLPPWALRGCMSLEMQICQDLRAGVLVCPPVYAHSTLYIVLLVCACLFVYYWPHSRPHRVRTRLVYHTITSLWQWKASWLWWSPTCSSWWILSSCMQTHMYTHRASFPGRSHCCFLIACSMENMVEGRLGDLVVISGIVQLVSIIQCSQCHTGIDRTSLP